MIREIDGTAFRLHVHAHLSGILAPQSVAGAPHCSNPGNTRRNDEEQDDTILDGRCAFLVANKSLPELHDAPEHEQLK